MSFSNDALVELSEKTLKALAFYSKRLKKPMNEVLDLAVENFTVHPKASDPYKRFVPECNYCNNTGFILMKVGEDISSSLEPPKYIRAYCPVCNDLESSSLETLNRVDSHIEHLTRQIELLKKALETVFKVEFDPLESELSLNLILAREKARKK